MQRGDQITQWVRKICSTYKFEPVAIYRRPGKKDNRMNGLEHLKRVTSVDHLTSFLANGGFFLPLPREPAAIANIIEVSLCNFLKKEFEKQGLSFTRGGERSYPDLEITGGFLRGRHVAIDIKSARYQRHSKNTDSRITLYTGNTYFKFHRVKSPGSLRAFSSYFQHLDIVVLFVADPSALAGIASVEVIVHETWKLGSKKRSSMTREYIGAVTNLESIRDGRGEFGSEADFYRYWRRFKFRKSMRQVRSNRNKS